jgi:hypothetical protein
MGVWITVQTVSEELSEDVFFFMFKKCYEFVKNVHKKVF